MKKSIIIMVMMGFIQTIASAKDANILAYKDRGIKYYPKYVKTGLIKFGKASWYGKPFHGRLTANGERYNMYKMTAAHRTYAMNTILKVTNLHNNKSIKVRINDRGPFYNTRDIDLSYGAARKLGMVQKGVGKVKIEVLSSGSKRILKTYSKKAIISKKSNSKNHIILSKNPNILREHKIQVASFFTKKNAKTFTQKNKLKHVKIIKKYNLSLKKSTYKVIINCTPWEARQLLKSKKFEGAYPLY